jgi:protein O-GlcNAc transferase
VKLISFSLWGADPKYVRGAIRNAALAATVYPGWTCRFYCARSVPADAIAALAAFAHVTVVRREEQGDWRAMFWRFEAAAETGAEAILFRDTDSRLNSRERAAVDAWLASDAAAHVMRDHPDHNVPILGGMWGVRGGVLPDIATLIGGSEHGDYWQVDQEFLAAKVAPRRRPAWIGHDEYFGGRPFPTRRRWREFVGQPFDERDRPLITGPTRLEWRLRRIASAVKQQVLKG